MIRATAGAALVATLLLAAAVAGSEDRIFLKNGETLNVPNVKVSVFGEGPFVLIAQRGTEDEFTFVSDNIAGWQTTIV